MNQQDFEVVVLDTITEIQKLLRVKGGEYAGSADRLANFKRGAALTGVTPLQCLFIYMSKHYDSVSTYVRKDAAGVAQVLSEPIEGRLDDIINYCLLAKAIIKEAALANPTPVPNRDPVQHSGGIHPGSWLADPARARVQHPHDDVAQPAVDPVVHPPVNR